MKRLRNFNPMKWLAAHELVALLVLCVMAGSIWVFAELADEVFDDETHVFDRAVLLAMRNPQDASDPLGPYWLEDAVRDLTALGSWVTLTILTLAVIGYLALRGSYGTLVLVLAAIVGGTVLAFLMKMGFDRARPDLIPDAPLVYTASFPSGHSMLSAVVYLTLAALLAQIHPDYRVKLYLLLLGAGLAFLVGTSRVYLGVHWPTDVLAGWAAGAAWAAICWLVSWTLRHRTSLAARFRGQ